MKLIHHSKTNLFDIHSVEQGADCNANWVGKPRGLWVSVDDAWQEWCSENDFGIGEYKHEIVLKPDAKILRIETSEALHAFTKQYGKSNDMDGALRLARHLIDWREVASRYHGIIIAPYQWSCRLSMETFWYYSWDCASGCIWNADAILEIVRKETKGDGIRFGET